MIFRVKATREYEITEKEILERIAANPELRENSSFEHIATDMVIDLISSDMETMAETPQLFASFKVELIEERFRNVPF